jgi:hypothetical protein
VGALGAFLEGGGESDYLAPLDEHCLRSPELVDCVKAYLIAVKCVVGREKVYYFMVF